MNTTSEIILVIATVLPVLVHIFGWSETKAGQIVTSVSLDIVGAYKAARAKGDESEPSK